MILRLARQLSYGLDKGPLYKARTRIIHLIPADK